MASKAELEAQLASLEAELVKVRAEYAAVVAERDALKAAANKRTLLISRGHLALMGKPINRTVVLPPPTVSWKAIPNFTIDRTKPFPQYINGIRANYLNDPGNRVTSVTLVDV